LVEGTGWIPGSEKIRIVNQVLRSPGCRVPAETVRSLGDAVKLELFERLVATGKLTMPLRLVAGAEQGQQGQRVGHRGGNASPQGSTTAYSVIGQNIENEIYVAISQQARQQGLYIIGATGTGKSTLIASLILNDIAQGLGVCLIEPHGDLTNTVLAGIPENRLADVILLDMTDHQYPFGLNLFECADPTNHREAAIVASFVYHVFEKLWDVGTETPRLMQVLRAVTRTLIENQGTTLAEVPLLFSNDQFRVFAVARLTNREVAAFWNEFSRKSQYARDEYVDSTLNKVRSFLDEPIVRNIVGQSKTTIQFRAVMDQGKILLVKLSPQFTEASHLIGAIIIGKLLLSAYARADTPEQERRQFNLYCDEFQYFATSDIAGFIAEGSRKFRVPITLAHQTLSQLHEANRAAAATAANIMVFRVNGEDAATLAKNFDTTPTKEQIGEEPERAPVSDVIHHLAQRGHNNERVARFGLTYLKNLENFVWNPPHVGYAGPFTNKPSDMLGYGVVGFYGKHIFHEGRELLNRALYQSMIERSARFLIPPLALYILAIAQQDDSDSTFQPVITCWDKIFAGFKDEAVVFGDPYFISTEFAPQFIASRRDRVKAAASAVIRMLTELRYTMDILAQQPILVDTGQYKPKYQNRTFADMEHEIARDLAQLPNFHAKIRLLEGEGVIRTEPLPRGHRQGALQLRIDRIKAHMRASHVGYCRDFREVENEINHRQQQWPRTDREKVAPRREPADPAKPQSGSARSGGLPPTWG
jgi:hypothetical protein